jgi:hypothetical protein
MPLSKPTVRRAAPLPPPTTRCGLAVGNIVHEGVDIIERDRGNLERPQERLDVALNAIGVALDGARLLGDLAARQQAPAFGILEIAVA